MRGESGCEGGFWTWLRRAQFSQLGMTGTNPSGSKEVINALNKNWRWDRNVREYKLFARLWTATAEQTQHSASTQANFISFCLNSKHAEGIILVIGEVLQI